MKTFTVPNDYDYIGVYLTNKCHLDCSYCITKHFDSGFRMSAIENISPDQWNKSLNRLNLPKDMPISLQGGEPFLYKGIWEILGGIRHKCDILTALPPFLTKGHFESLKSLDWNQRQSPYPTIRVSYHKGQHSFQELVERVAELQDILSIGIYYLDHPCYEEEEIRGLEDYANKYGVELRSKEFLGEWEGNTYGTYLYDDASSGKRAGRKVMCRNTVVPIGPDGSVYRCHSDLYFNRKELAIGNITDEVFAIPPMHLSCENYGLCSECDVKVKTNHFQVHGYTSVDIKFMDEEMIYECKTAENINN